MRCTAFGAFLQASRAPSLERGGAAGVASLLSSGRGRAVPSARPRKFSLKTCAVREKSRVGQIKINLPDAGTLYDGRHVLPGKINNGEF